MGLLPKDQEIGWTPYAYLVYLAFFYVEPVVRPFSALEWTAQISITLVFLGLFFRGFWVRGRRLYPIIAAIVVLGAVAVTYNGGGSVFFIYAAGFLGEVGPIRRGVSGLAILLLVTGLLAWVLQLHPGSWITAIVFSLIVGGLNIHYGQVRRRNARLRLAQEEVERLAKSHERERIARDLHDLLGHTLSVITLKSELAGRQLDAGADSPALRDRARDELRDIERISRDAMAEVRRAVRGFRDLKLQTELAKARMALESAAISFELESTPYDFSPEHESVFALALREAVVNVIKHARATTCSVSINTRRGIVELLIRDDGRGLRGPEGAGLTGMRERVESIGGQLTVDDRDRRGASVRVVAPARHTGSVGGRDFGATPGSAIVRGGRGA